MDAKCITEARGRGNFQCPSTGKQLEKKVHPSNGLLITIKNEAALKPVIEMPRIL